MYAHIIGIYKVLELPFGVETACAFWKAVVC
jgi:hypothetical protein